MYDVATLGIGLPLFTALTVPVAMSRMPATIVGTMLVYVPVVVVGIAWLKKRILRARTERLGFLGECATAEALISLRMEGWAVFHDLPLAVNGSGFNIDHVAVSPTGIFAIETKTYSKPRVGGGETNHLQIKGERVILPDGRSKEPLKEARGRAAALRDWFRSKGVAVDFVQPLVVLPGWKVNYTKGSTERIRDPRNIGSWIRSFPDCCPEKRQREAVDALEARCRSLSFEKGAIAPVETSDNP
jgi:hypothetical protein